MMKKLFMSTLLAASSTLLMTGTASAQPNSVTNHSTTNVANKEAYQDKMLKRFESLNLSDAQKTQIKAIMQARHKDTDRSKVRNDHKEMQQKIKVLTQSNTLDTRTLNQLADEQAQKAKQRFIDRVQTQHAIAQVLTTEQRAQLATMQGQRHQQKSGFAKRSR